MSEEKTPTEKKSTKATFTVVSTNKYIVLSNDSVIVEVTKGGHAKSDGVKFEIGVSLSDINESRTRRKLGKVEPKLSEKEIDAIVNKNRANAVEAYKSEILSKLEEVGAEADLIKAVEKELKSEDIERILS